MTEQNDETTDAPDVESGRLNPAQRRIFDAMLTLRRMFRGVKARQRTADLVSQGVEATRAKASAEREQSFKIGPTVEDEIRLRKPGKACAADYEGFRAKAIDLFCEGCAGSLAMAGTCTSYACQLWPYRPGPDTTARPPGSVPTIEQYQELRDGKITEAQRAHHDTLRKRGESE